MSNTDSNSSRPRFNISRADDAVTVSLAGDWRTEDLKSEGHVYPAVNLLQSLRKSLARGVSAVAFDSSDLTGWDSRLLVALAGIVESAEQQCIRADLTGLPSGARALIDLARAVPSRVQSRHDHRSLDFLSGVGQGAIDVAKTLGDAVRFLGESLLSLWRFIRGKARFMKSDIVDFIQSTGPQALPIVGTINVLLGVILGFMGAVQLREFGAEIYVANLVALGQTREIAPMMTAIVMAGRTGAAYAAQLGTMQVNEEIDALKTFGFSPMDFLVLPRMLALAVMFPVLVLYADALGMFGGYLVGVGVLGLGTTEYIEQTRQAIDMGDIILGIVKGSVFGILIAITGCMQGMQSGRSASAVGGAATRAVVTGIMSIIVMTAVFAVMTNVLGI